MGSLNFKCCEHVEVTELTCLRSCRCCCGEKTDKEPAQTLDLLYTDSRSQIVILSTPLTYIKRICEFSDNGFTHEAHMFEFVHDDGADVIRCVMSSCRSEQYVCKTLVEAFPETDVKFMKPMIEQGLLGMWLQVHILKNGIARIVRVLPQFDHHNKVVAVKYVSARWEGDTVDVNRFNVTPRANTRRLAPGKPALKQSSRVPAKISGDCLHIAEKSLHHANHSGVVGSSASLRGDATPDDSPPASQVMS